MHPDNSEPALLGGFVIFLGDFFGKAKKCTKISKKIGLPSCNSRKNRVK
jgi:homoserine kinase